MFLTDNEKRDIIKYIEAAKPLPDKYRFLLVEEKREVELVWDKYDKRQLFPSKDLFQSTSDSTWPVKSENKLFVLP